MLVYGSQSACLSPSEPDVGWMDLESRAAAYLFPIPVLSSNGPEVSYGSGTFQTAVQYI